MAQHAQLRTEANLDIYFCDPRSPWQRGTNHNTNGLLRQYFPKGTDLHRHSRNDLDAVAAALNSRPRKTLNEPPRVSRRLYWLGDNGVMGRLMMYSPEVRERAVRMVLEHRGGAPL